MDSDSAAVGSMTIDDDNIIVNLEASDCSEVIRRLGGLLLDNGFVKDTFIQAVLDREQVFPTGLQTTLYGIAIPHTDTEHVIHPALAIATLAQPVNFQGMGMPDTAIPVTIVIMLAVDDPKAVIPVLRSVLFILENAEALEALSKASSKTEIQQIMQNHINAMKILISSETSVDNSQ